jgi:hypothetical protein
MYNSLAFKSMLTHPVFGPQMCLIALVENTDAIKLLQIMHRNEFILKLLSADENSFDEEILNFCMKFLLHGLKPVNKKAHEISC